MSNEWGKHGNQEYDEYLQSDTWKQKRKERLEYDDNKCTCCNSDENLQVHHITYERGLGNEEKEDLITLCKECHMKLHELHDMKKPELDKAREIYKQKCLSVIMPLHIKYVHYIKKELGEAYFEMRGPSKGNLHTATLYSVVARALGLGGDEAGKDCNLHGLLPSRYKSLLGDGKTLCRILTGKKKYKGVDTIEQWEARYEEALHMAINEATDIFAEIIKEDLNEQEVQEVQEAEA